MELAWNSNGEPSAAFLGATVGKARRPALGDPGQRPGPPGPGDAVILGHPGLNLRLVSMPANRPKFNADEAIWRSVREGATGNKGGGAG